MFRRAHEARLDKEAQWRQDWAKYQNECDKLRQQRIDQCIKAQKNEMDSAMKKNTAKIAELHKLQENEFQKHVKAWKVKEQDILNFQQNELNKA